MDALTSLIAGFSTALTPTNLMFAFLGVLLGTAIGVLPGLGPALTIAVPSVTPAKAHMRFQGCSATPKPCARWPSVSIQPLPRKRLRKASKWGVTQSTKACTWDSTMPEPIR